MSRHAKPSLAKSLATVLACSSLLAAQLNANPVGGAVAAGSAGIAGEGTGAVTVRQTSNRAIIDWNTFSIGAGETTSFIQPSATSAVLNRVLGGQTSVINGTLSANGQVYLVNGNGIVIGPGGAVNAGAFTASTRDITDANFLAGNLRFAGDNNAGVQNLGVINALGGDVVLIGKTVSNSGVINAANGTAALVAADDVLLGQKNADGSTVTVSPVPLSGSDLSTQTGVSNAGLITAAAAELKAANGNLYALAIQNSGVIRATTVSRQGGRIYLVADTGTIINSGTLDASASTSATGAQGGSVTMKDMGGTTIDTGAILATGGQGGAGGNAEVSGQIVRFSGTIDLTAAGGTTGTLFLDPTTFTVAASGGDETGTAVSDALATANIILNADNAVTINDAIAWTSSNTLTLSTTLPGGTIAINAAITGANGGLAINAAGATDAISATAAINVASFILQNGAWVQNTASLPAFSATNDFEIQGGTFLRVLGGDGSSGNPYQLTDVYGLQGVNGYLGGDFELANNIDATATATWNAGAGFAPIGSGSTPFTGTFDGQGNTISGLVINRPDTNFVGLFGYAASGSVLKNIGLEGGSVSGSEYVGGLVGFNYGTVSTSYATGGVSAGSGSEYVGGLVGFNDGVGFNYGTVSTSYATGGVNAGSGSEYVGGLVGENYDGTVETSYWLQDTGTNTGLYGIGSTASNTGATPETLAALENSMPSGFSASTWGNAGNQTTPYLLSNPGLVYTVNGGSNPYQIILGAAQLQGIDSSAATLAGNYALGNSIELSSVAGFAPIGSGSTPFTGTFDGLGFVIDGLTTGSPSASYVGLFGYNSGVIQNLGVTNVNITGASDVGALAGENDGIITASYATGNVTAPAPAYPAYSSVDDIGGLVGYNVGTVTASYATADVAVPTAPYYASGIGGLVGNSTGTVTTSYATGNVSSSAYFTVDIGGLVGYNVGTVTASYATADVAVTTASYYAIGIGGLVGDSTSTGTVTTSYATGAVTVAATDSIGSVGGLIGENDGNVTLSYATGDLVIASGPYASSIGGLVGINNGNVATSYETGGVTVDETTTYSIGGLVGLNSGNVTTSYSTGAVSVTPASPGQIGGLVGQNGGNVTSSYWLQDATANAGLPGIGADNTNGGGADNIGATPETLAQLQEASTYDSTWDFTLGTGAWAIGGQTSAGVVNGGLPYFQWQVPTIALVASDQSVTYGDSIVTTGTLGTTYTVAGLGGGTLSDYVAGNVTLTLDGSNVNAGTTNAIDIGATPASANYAVEYVNGTETLTQRQITVSSDAGQTKVYGTSDPGSAATAYAVTSGSLVGADTLAGDMGRVAGENAGSYDFTQGNVAVSDGNGGDNYAITFDGSTNPFVITKASSLTASIADQTKMYGASDPSVSGVTVTLGGVVDATVTDINGDSTMINDTGAVATTLAGLTRDTGENTGDYAITGATFNALTGSAAANYAAPTALTGSPTLAITPATLTYAANAASAFAGQGIPALTGTVTGFVNGDTLQSATTGTLAFTTDATAASPAGSYAIDGSGLAADNYVFVQAADNATALTIGAYQVGNPSWSGGAANPFFNFSVLTAQPHRPAAVPAIVPAAKEKKRTAGHAPSEPFSPTDLAHGSNYTTNP